MLFFTSSFFYKDGEMLQLVNGSVQSTTTYFGTSRILNICLFIICLICLIGYFRNKKKSIYIFFGIFIIWMLSGRTIGVYYTGELSLGWFYVETDKVLLWEKDNCEDNVLENTDFKVKNLCTISYENNCVSGDVYVGPFIITQLTGYLKQ